MNSVEDLADLRSADGHLDSHLVRQEQVDFGVKWRTCGRTDGAPHMNRPRVTADRLAAPRVHLLGGFGDGSRRGRRFLLFGGELLRCLAPESRDALRTRAPLVACVAGDLSAAREGLAVEIAHRLNHDACGLLGLPVVLLEAVGNVAISETCAAAPGGRCSFTNAVYRPQPSLLSTATTQPSDS